MNIAAGKLFLSLCLPAFIAFFALISASGFSATYCVSKSGSDSNDGTTWALALLNIKIVLAKLIWRM